MLNFISKLLGYRSPMMESSEGGKYTSDRAQIMSMISQLRSGSYGGTQALERIKNRLLGQGADAAARISQQLSESFARRGLSGSRLSGSAEAGALSDLWGQVLGKMADVDVRRAEAARSDNLAAMQFMNSLLGQDAGMDKFNRNLAFNAQQGNFSNMLQYLGAFKNLFGSGWGKTAGGGK